LNTRVAPPGILSLIPFSPYANDDGIIIDLDIDNIYDNYNLE
jgi:hypothetical protein